MLLQDWLWEQGVVGSNPVAPTIIQNRWLSRQYELESQRFFSCLDVSFSLLFVNHLVIDQLRLTDNGLAWGA